MTRVACVLCGRKTADPVYPPAEFYEVGEEAGLQRPQRGTPHGGPPASAGAATAAARLGDMGPVGSLEPSLHTYPEGSPVCGREAWYILDEFAETRLLDALGDAGRWPYARPAFGDTLDGWLAARVAEFPTAEDALADLLDACRTDDAERAWSDAGLALLMIERQTRTRRLEPVDPEEGVVFKTKKAALEAFILVNLSVIEHWGGLHVEATGGEFDAVNERYGLRGISRVTTLGRALQVVMPAGKPYRLDRLDLATLNDCQPAKEEPGPFRLPDEVAMYQAARGAL